MRKSTAILMGIFFSAVDVVEAQDEHLFPSDSYTASVASLDQTRSEGSGGLGIEFPVGDRAWQVGKSDKISIRPVAGITGTFNRAFMNYAGFRTQVALAPGWALEPGTSIGRYERNHDDRYIGGPVEFRSGLRVWRTRESGSRIGIELFHISNAGIYRNNPGYNGLVMIHTFGGPTSRRQDDLQRPGTETFASIAGIPIFLHPYQPKDNYADTPSIQSIVLADRRVAILKRSVE